MFKWIGQAIVGFFKSMIPSETPTTAIVPYTPQKGELVLASEATEPIYLSKRFKVDCQRTKAEARKMLAMLENDGGKWEYRYECSNPNCTYVGIVAYVEPCRRCGSRMDDWKNTYKYLRCYGMWVRKDRYDAAISTLKSLAA